MNKGGGIEGVRVILQELKGFGAVRSSPFFDGRRERLQKDAVRTIGAGWGAEDLGGIPHGSEFDGRVDHRRAGRINYRAPDQRGAGRADQQHGGSDLQKQEGEDR